MLDGETETETEAEGEDDALIVTLAVADAVGWAVLCAVTSTGLDGAVAGARYTPEKETVPTAALPPSTPLTSQFTPLFHVPDTDAVNCCDCPTGRLADPGDMVTETFEFPPWCPLFASAAGKHVSKKMTRLEAMRRWGIFIH